ncbi:hypothetical protein KSP40_PGU021191 [Platanthera guangdongensis]|uniref:Uncharacterized protein n=1 Tax=Platanthera guangdongensis TaxID=2320717 RepID=A0ABR2M8X6_9ASPA
MDSYVRKSSAISQAMAASFCPPIALPICISSARQMSILAGASSSGGSGGQRQGHSTRNSFTSGARLRVCQPCTLLGPSAGARKRRSVHCGAVRTIGESEFAGEVLGSNIPKLWFMKIFFFLLFGNFSVHQPEISDIYVVILDLFSQIT